MNVIPISELHDGQKFSFVPRTQMASIYVPGEPAVEKEEKPGERKEENWIRKPMWYVTLTGAVEVNLQGAGSHWKQEEYEFTIKFVRNDLYNWPSGHKFLVKGAAPFITINSIHNDGRSVNAGWDVGRFWGPNRGDYLEDWVKLFAWLRVRDVDGYLFRIGYSLTMNGVAEKEAD